MTKVTVQFKLLRKQIYKFIQKNEIELQMNILIAPLKMRNIAIFI